MKYLLILGCLFISSCSSLIIAKTCHATKKCDSSDQDCKPDKDVEESYVCKKP